MPDLLVVVVEVTGREVRASLAPVDRPGEVVRGRAPRSADLLADTAAVLGRLGAGGLAPVLLAVAVSVGADVDPAAAARLQPRSRRSCPRSGGCRPLCRRCGRSPALVVVSSRHHYAAVPQPHRT